MIQIFGINVILLNKCFKNVSNTAKCFIANAKAKQNPITE